jgi:hypothetical protein
VDLNIAGQVATAGKKHRVARRGGWRLELSRHRGDIVKFPDFAGGPHGKSAAFPGETHGLEEIAEMRVDDGMAVVRFRPEENQLAGLVSRHGDGESKSI